MFFTVLAGMYVHTNVFNHTITIIFIVLTYVHMNIHADKSMYIHRYIHMYVHAYI